MLINKTVLYASEAACILGCSVMQIYCLIHEGKLHAYKDEGCRAWHIPEESIMAYISSRMRKKH